MVLLFWGFLMKIIRVILAAFAAHLPLWLLAQKAAPKPRRWGDFGGKPAWPPRYETGAPVPDEVPIDSYDFVLFLTGLVMVYVLWQRANGSSWKEIIRFNSVYSFLASKI